MIAKTIYRVSQTSCTILIRYMALASLPEIARPSSEMVVGYMYIEINFGVGEKLAVRVYFGPQPPPDCHKLPPTLD